jgi:hypothetical protein
VKKGGALTSDISAASGWPAEIRLPSGAREPRGAVECEVHAENLTKPSEARLIVERKIESISMVDLAKSIVDNRGWCGALLAALQVDPLSGK